MEYKVCISRTAVARWHLLTLNCNFLDPSTRSTARSTGDGCGVPEEAPAEEVNDPFRFLQLDIPPFFRRIYTFSPLINLLSMEVARCGFGVGYPTPRFAENQSPCIKVS